MAEKKTISTTSDAIDALGGISPTQILTGRARRTVYLWRETGKFPPKYQRLLSKELRSRGYKPAPSLWRMV